MNNNNREIKWYKLTRKEWLEQVPEIVYTLRKRYGFYMSFSYVYKIKDLQTYITKSQNRHKMIFCQDRNNRYYFIIFAKNFISVYYSIEYIPKTGKYFSLKCQSKYDQAETELDEEEEREYRENTL